MIKEKKQFDSPLSSDYKDHGFEYDYSKLVPIISSKKKKGYTEPKAKKSKAKK